jgi:branched-chain amino acid transport system permease protein
MGVGAYACYKLTTIVPDVNILVWIVLSGFVSAAVGVVFGLPSLRIKGFYLVVATLAAQFFLQWCFVRIPWLYNYNASGAIEVAQRTLLGSGIESWFAFVIALLFLLFRPQGLFGERIIERI